MSGNDPQRPLAAVIETPMEETSEKPSKSWILGFDRRNAADGVSP